MSEVRQLLAGLSADPVPKLRPVPGRDKASRRGLPAYSRDQISVANAEHAEGTHPPEGTRRDFLYIATGAVGGVGIALTLWPFISQMNPDASVLALAAIDRMRLAPESASPQSSIAKSQRPRVVVRPDRRP